MEALLGLNDFPLEGIVLALRDLAVGKGRVCLLSRCFQRGELLFGITDRLAQKPVLLRQQLRIAGV